MKAFAKKRITRNYTGRIPAVSGILCDPRRVGKQVA